MVSNMRCFASRLFFHIALLAHVVTAITVTSQNSWNITSDVEGSVRLNGLAFQQQPLTTFGNYQYIAFYSTGPSGYGHHYVNVGRRQISPSLGAWQYLTLTDYDQTTEDEHNTISMGISGDGKIHLSFDHHDVPLNYRVSNAGIAKTIPSSWTASLFGSVQHTLPGSTGPWTPLTYPRFEPLANGDIIMEFRIGQSGAGDSYIHRYSSSTGSWTALGKYLQGEDDNAYINGITSQSGKLYASWTVRETPEASTNHDFYFAYSDDDGVSWKQTSGATVSKPITPSTAGIKVYTIPQNSQIINQEAQFADSKGRFHALMKDNSTGTAKFYHYLRTAEGVWSKNAINVAVSTPPYLSFRGKLVSTASGNTLIALLPDQPLLTLTIWASTASGNFQDWKKLATIPNSQSEPGVDYVRLAKNGVLSVFVRQGGPYPTRQVQVWDFGLSE